MGSPQATGSAQAMGSPQARPPPRAPFGRRRPTQYQVGPGADAGMDVGPVISKAALERVTGLIQSGVDEGAELLLDGRAPSVPKGCEAGYFVGPTIFGKAKRLVDAHTHTHMYMHMHMHV